MKRFSTEISHAVHLKSLNISKCELIDDDIFNFLSNISELKELSKLYLSCIIVEYKYYAFNIIITIIDNNLNGKSFLYLHEYMNKLPKLEKLKLCGIELNERSVKLLLYHYKNKPIPLRFSFKCIYYIIHYVYEYLFIYCKLN